MSRSLTSLADTLAIAWTWARRIFIFALVAGLSVFVLEWLHLHALLAGIHPALAWSVTGLLMAATVVLAGSLAWRWWSVPRVLMPPELPPPAEGWTPRQARAYLRFARQYLERQSANPALDPQAATGIGPALDRIAALDADLPAGELVQAVENQVDLALEPLDRKARQEVWQAACQVAALTAINPSSLLDVLITLLRNLDLMARLATLYGGRPGLVSSLRIVRDVLASAATAGLLDRLAESASSVAAEMVGSWTTRLAGPVGQGLVNGLLTVRLGDAAVARCRSLRSRRVGIKPWSAATWREMARRLSAMVSRTLAPEMSRAFKEAARSATTRSGGALRRAWQWMRGSGSVPDDPPLS
ncbi:MAG: YcjF family protein [Acidobacteriota bacterium]|nr:YcjF family protein [Acidobacteriota bacterium]